MLSSPGRIRIRVCNMLRPDPDLWESRTVVMWQYKYIYKSTWSISVRVQSRLPDPVPIMKSLINKMKNYK